MPNPAVPTKTTSKEQHAEPPPARVDLITVTATRRNESIQNVPVSVTAVSGATLEKLEATKFDDYAHLSPDLSFGTGNGFGVTTARQITIRGIAGTNTTAFYINDTPVPQSLDPRVLDLQRIEVLRGPQGTLFGSSSMGGLVRLITNRPVTDSSFGYLDAKGFDVNKGGAGWDTSGSYNFGLIPGQLAANVSGYDAYTPGIYTRLYGYPTTPGYVVPASQLKGEQKNVGDDRDYGGMFSLTWTPSVLPGLTLTPMVIHQNTSGRGLPLSDYSPDNLLQVRPLDVAEALYDRWTFSALTGKYDLGFGRIVSSSTYLHRQTFDDEDGTEAVAVIFGTAASPPLGSAYQASPSPSFVNTKSFTQEVRFESAFRGPIQIIGGGYYHYTASNTIQREYTPYVGGEPAFFENIPGINREWATFFNVDYRITRQLEFSAGVRQAWLQYQSAYIAGGWINGGPSDNPSAHHEPATTPRFSVKYTIAPGHMVYTTVAQGYRIGGQNATLPPICAGEGPSGAGSYNSDSLWSYEVGAKDTWFNGRVSTRAALYRIDWSGLQQSVLLPCTYHVTENAGAAVSQGGELEASADPLPGLRLTTALGYDDGHITNSPPGAAFVAGQPLNGVPKWTASLVGEYTYPTSFGSAFIRSQYSFTSSSESFNNDPEGRRRKAYQLLNIIVGVQCKSWTASLYVKNLGDTRGDLGDEQSEVSEIPGRGRYLIVQPRTIGVDIRKNF